MNGMRNKAASFHPRPWSYRVADDFAKPGHEHLLGFVDDVNRGRNQNDETDEQVR